jgi:hypothetical protein
MADKFYYESPKQWARQQGGQTLGALADVTQDFVDYFEERKRKKQEDVFKTALMKRGVKEGWLDPEMVQGEGVLRTEPLKVYEGTMRKPIKKITPEMAYGGKLVDPGKMSLQSLLTGTQLFKKPQRRSIYSGVPGWTRKVKVYESLMAGREKYALKLYDDPMDDPLYAAYKDATLDLEQYGKVRTATRQKIKRLGGKTPVVPTVTGGLPPGYPEKK